MIDASASGRHARPSIPSGASTNSGRLGEARAMAPRLPPTVAGAHVPRHEDTALPTGRGRRIDDAERARR